MILKWKQWVHFNSIYLIDERDQQPKPPDVILRMISLQSHPRIVDFLGTKQSQSSQASKVINLGTVVNVNIPGSSNILEWPTWGIYFTIEQGLNLHLGNRLLPQPRVVGNCSTLMANLPKNLFLTYCFVRIVRSSIWISSTLFCWIV